MSGASGEINGGANVPSRLYALAKKFNVFYLSKYKSGTHKPFVIGAYLVGFISPKMMKIMHNFPNVFIIESSYVYLHPSLDTYESRSNAVEQVLQSLRRENAFIALKGWRNECYEVAPKFGDTALMKIERAAACLLGIRQYGVAINGYVLHPTKGMCIWLQKRAEDKPTWPGYFDNMVGGAISVGYTVLETARKEAQEEATITEPLLEKLIPIGTVTIFYESERGLSPNTEYVYDLELPVEYEPINCDREVESFHLVSTAEALELMLQSNFKTTSAPILMDFLIRHKVITHLNEPNLSQVMNLLHIPLSTIYKQV